MDKADYVLNFGDIGLCDKNVNIYGNVKTSGEFAVFEGGSLVIDTDGRILPSEVKKAITLFFRVCIADEGWNNRTIICYGNEKEPSFRLYTYIAGIDPALNSWDDLQQNYISYPCKDGKIRVLEAEITLYDMHNKARIQRIGVPAALVGEVGWHDIVLRTDGIHFDLFVDGVLVDQEWTVGDILHTKGPLYIGATNKNIGESFYGLLKTFAVWHAALTDEEIAAFSGSIEDVRKRKIQILGSETEGPLQYWTPRGHNTWVGDTSCYYFNGAFHLLYLTDRRHGESKFRGGGHQFAHASSTDLIKWEHHPMAVPIDEEWQTIGTGNVLCENGKCYLFYGMHTDRFVDYDLTMDRDMKEAELEDGTTQPLPFFHNGKYPMGSAIAISEDGIHFNTEKTIVHRAQNPGIYKDESTDLYYFLAGYGADGVYYSRNMCEWKRTDSIIPFGPESDLRNTSECQCLFEWNGWHYILAGRTGYWMSNSFFGPYWSKERNENVIVPRWDIYDGLWVPMVAEFNGNRRILAGWLQGNTTGWAGHLVFRELVQLSDGTLGMKWPEEMVPGTGDIVFEDSNITVSDMDFKWEAIQPLPESYYLKMNIEPSSETDSFGLCFIGNGAYESGCELRFDSKNKRVQWGTPLNGNMAPRTPSFSEVIAKSGPEGDYSSSITSPNIHYKGLDFTIENVEGLDQKFTLEAIVKYDAKSGSSIIDICINSRRTMITRRSLTGEKLFLFVNQGSVQFGKVCIKELL